MKQKYSVEAKEGYIHLETRGTLDIADLEAPANAALEAAKKHKIDKLLDDIREVDASELSIHMQAKSMGIIWKLRSFKKVAVIMKSSRIQSLFLSSVSALNLNATSQFKGFDNIPDAVTWLQE